MPNKEDTLFLKQLVHTLEETEKKLEESYNKKDYGEFNKAKALMINIQKNISERV